MATRQPRLANWRAVAAPMPDEPPVMSATFIPWPLDSNRSYRRRRRADGAGQSQRRRCHQEAIAAMGAQPPRKLGEVPELAKMDAVLEDAVLVQRHGGVRPR